MAITKIHAIRSSIQKAVDYICNPDKTEGSILIDSFACNHHTAEPEFLMAISQGTGQGNKLAFHLIQSFAPDEVDAATAHEIGSKLAERLLKGNYSYVLATHTDKHSVHNHIIFCSVDNFSHRKYYDNKKTYHDIRGISDLLCHEYRLSVIEDRSGKRGLSYDEWMNEGEGRSWKVLLREDIKKCIRGSNTYDDFLLLMKDLGYEIKGEALRGTFSDTGHSGKAAKYICFRAPGQAHFIRGSIRGLGKGYSREDIYAAIVKQAEIRAMASPIPVRKMEDLVKKTGPYERLVDRSSEEFQKSPYLNRWADRKDLKSVSHAFTEAGDTVQLQNLIESDNEKVADIRVKMVELDRKLNALKELSVYAKNCEAYRGVYKAYREAKDAETYYEAHESQIMIYEASERDIRAMGIDPGRITSKQVMESIEKLKAQQEEIRSEYRSLSKELAAKKQQLKMMQEYMDRNDIKRDRHKKKPFALQDI